MEFRLRVFAVAVCAVWCCVAPQWCGAQQVRVLESRADGSALLQSHETAFEAASAATTKIRIDIDPRERFQTMAGFGASLTDSSATLIEQLPAEERKAVMREMFEPAGPLGLTLLRQPIGASDFSAHANYSYDDSPNNAEDATLAHFSVAKDETSLFPLLREAEHLNPQLRMMAMPWSPPAWMKSDHSMNAGQLEERDVPAYAQYLARTVAAYHAEGVPLFALALQNEPLNENATYPTALMQPEQEARLGAALKPLLNAQGESPLLLGYEHNWDNLDYPNRLLAEAARLAGAGAAPVFEGISFHCYKGDERAQTAFVLEHPHTSIWFTECSGTAHDVFGDSLMWQARHLLLGATLNEARSVLLWNLVLDPRGGPHNGGCGDCRPLLTLETHAGKPATFARTSDFYLLAHAAPFVHPGAVRVDARITEGADVMAAAFENLDSTMVVLALNSGPAPQEIALWLGAKSALYKLPPRSLLTFTWGEPKPVLLEGTYSFVSFDAQKSGMQLEAAAGQGAPVWKAASGSVAQVWSLRRLPNGKFEVRNVGTSQALAISQGGALTTLTLPGNRVAALALQVDDGGFCMAPMAAGGCPSARRLRLVAAFGSGYSDKKAQ
jgi:glucosylceramidase